MTIKQLVSNSKLKRTCAITSDGGVLSEAGISRFNEEAEKWFETTAHPKQLYDLGDNVIKSSKIPTRKNMKPGSDIEDGFFLGTTYAMDYVLIIWTAMFKGQHVSARRYGKGDLRFIKKHMPEILWTKSDKVVDVEK